MIHVTETESIFLDLKNVEQLPVVFWLILFTLSVNTLTSTCINVLTLHVHLPYIECCQNNFDRVNTCRFSITNVSD